MALAKLHELPAMILKHRTLAKLKSTYADALVDLVHPRTGRIHTSYNQTVTATGRLSSSDPNLQNIPIRTEEGLEIRRAFVARPGWRLLSADYSQIELRILAHCSEDELLIRAFRRGGGHPHPDRVGGLRARARPGHARAAPPGQGHQLRDHLRDERLRARAAARDQPEDGQDLHRPLLRALPGGPGVRRAHDRRGPADPHARAPCSVAFGCCPTSTTPTRSSARRPSAPPSTRRSRARRPT